MFIYGISTITGRILYSLRKQRELFLLPLVNIISIIVFSAILIPAFGLYGVSVEFVMTQFIAFVVSYLILVKHKPELKIKTKEILLLDEYDRIAIMRGYFFIKNKVKVFLRI
jgi:O-antigen/teichoic acid export membrane protein